MQVSCGGRHSLALVQGGEELWAWGWGKYGQLGLAGDTALHDLPQRVPLPLVDGGGADAAAAVVSRKGGESAAWQVGDVEGGRWHTIVAMEHRCVA